jgi:HD-like signal output (HDOD) protein
MDSMEKEKLLDRLTESDYLPSLSPLAMRLIGLAADEQSSILDLARVIEQDPGLTARLLKIVNSAFFAHREPISSISYAVMVAGFNKIRLMALNLCLKDTFPLGKVQGMDYDYFWKTSLYRAIIAQDLVKGSPLSSEVDHEEAFTAGLILEIGHPLCFHLCPAELKDAFPGGDDPLEDILQWEEEKLGYHHRQLGARTLEKWNLPPSFVEIQRVFGSQALKEGVAPFTQVMEIARACTHLFFGRGREDFSLLERFSQLMEISLERLTEILSNAFIRVEDLARDLKIRIDPDQDRMDVMEKAGRVLSEINGSLEAERQKISGLPVGQGSSTPPLLSELSPKRRKEWEGALDIVAHEIRNPLTAIGGFARRIIKKGQEQSSELVQYAELIAQEAQRLEKVLNELMTFSGNNPLAEPGGSDKSTKS